MAVNDNEPFLGGLGPLPDRREERGIAADTVRSVGRHKVICPISCGCHSVQSDVMECNRVHPL
jgi:hypothetical protein